MKKQFMFTFLLIFIFTIINWGCSKTAGNENEAPSCTFSNPKNGEEIQKGTIITLSVNADDIDCSISEVRFYINDIGKSVSNSFPYNYNWNTSNESDGNYILKAICKDNSGLSTSDEISVSIVQEAENEPSAIFTANVTEIFIGDTVYFTDQSTEFPDNWIWDFSDGSLSTVQNPTHVFDIHGEYTISLMVSNEYGQDVETKEKYITVSKNDITGETGTLMDYDENIYNWIGIGTQAWMIENLKVTHYNNGDPIQTTDPINLDISNENQSHYYWSGYYDHQLKNLINNVQPIIDAGAGSFTLSELVSAGIITEDNAEQISYVLEDNGIDSSILTVQEIQNICNDILNNYLELDTKCYTWYTIIDERQVCPRGWHVPLNSEWIELIDYLGGEEVAGGKLKEVGFANWNEPNAGASNESGFTALPWGERFHNGSFENLKKTASFWSSSELNNLKAMNYKLSYDESEINEYFYEKNNGLSIRCIKD